MMHTTDWTLHLLLTMSLPFQLRNKWSRFTQTYKYEQATTTF